MFMLMNKQTRMQRMGGIVHEEMTFQNRYQKMITVDKYVKGNQVCDSSNRLTLHYVHYLLPTM